MKRNRLGLMAGIAAAAIVVGCTNMTPQQQGTLSGAAISGGNAWTGAAIGGVAGGIAGNIRGGRVQ